MEKPPTIGPYDAFTARLLVMEPKRRWQVMLNWSGSSQAGQARLVHAASSRVIRIHWQGDNIRLLDNQRLPLRWRRVRPQELAERGLVIPPAQLAAIFHNQIPKRLVYIGHGQWKGKGDWRGIRMRWHPGQKSLTLSDIAHGREVRFILLDHQE